MVLTKQADGVRIRASVLLPIILAAAVYLISSAGRGVTDYDEAYYVQPALHMVESGDWVTPYANGVRFLEKPPLLYWVTAASFKIFGIHEFALRLPTALAVIALVWIVMLILRSLGDGSAVMIGGLSVAFSAGTYLFTRETLHDIWLVLFLTLAVYAFIKWHLKLLHPLRPALLFYGAMAGGFLCKSLVGVAFPLGIVVLFFLLSRECPRWNTLHVVPGVLFFLLLAVPWHWLAAVRNAGFLHYFFIEEQFLRFLGMRELPVLWSLPLWLFWVLVPLWFFPWTVFLPAAVSANRKQEDRKRRILVRISVAWVVVILGFFSLSTRLEHYAFPALPALSIFVAAGIQRGTKSRAVLWGFRVLVVTGMLALLFGIVAGIWIAAGPGFDYGPSGASDRIAETDFSIMIEMPREIVESLYKPAAVTIVAMSVGFGIALWFERRRRRLDAFIAIAMVMVVVCGMIHWSMYLCEDLISSKKFGIAIGREARPGDRVVVIGDYETANSLNFYEPLNVQVVEGRAYALIPGMDFPDSPKILLTLDEFQSAWQSEERVFVLAPESWIAFLNLEGRELAQVLDRVVLCNH
ncbi:MAG: glycosyltransferase family 39 protein [Acidobacteriota bacterium]